MGIGDWVSAAKAVYFYLIFGDKNMDHLVRFLSDLCAIMVTSKNKGQRQKVKAKAKAFFLYAGTGRRWWTM